MNVLYERTLKDVENPWVFPHGLFVIYKWRLFHVGNVYPRDHHRVIPSNFQPSKYVGKRMLRQNGG